MAERGERSAQEREAARIERERRRAQQREEATMEEPAAAADAPSPQAHDGVEGESPLEADG
ncbi:MAG: nuclease, partial [Actinomycetota bacterium]|nr:nuclease [Actinomycetota bacterium]